MQGIEIKANANQEEKCGQNGRGAAQHIAGAAGREQTTHATTAAAAHAERAAFGLLQQNEHDERNGNQQLDNQKKTLHDKNIPGVWP